jgi:hypothetical protein
VLIFTSKTVLKTKNFLDYLPLVQWLVGTRFNMYGKRGAKKGIHKKTIRKFGLYKLKSRLFSEPLLSDFSFNLAYFSINHTDLKTYLNTLAFSAV